MGHCAASPLYGLTVFNIRERIMWLKLPGKSKVICVECKRQFKVT